MLDPGKVLQGRYKVERLLGSGGMSTVYLAEHLKLGRKLALKALKPNMAGSAAQLLAEARLMSSLSHPNLALVLDFFEEGGRPHLVLEFVDGRNLEEVAQLAPKPLSQRRVLEFADQLMDALDYLHSKNIVVRDLKPSNVMLDEHRRLRLIDFGLAKFKNPAQTVPDAPLGSLGYAPIEQYGHGIADQRSDIYALGATMLFLLSDQPPPDAASRLNAKVPLLDPRTVNESVTDALWGTLQSMLELEPGKRPADVAEVRARLVANPSAPPPAPKQRICPACGQVLQKSEQKKVEIDLCPGCCGVWLDRGELEQLVEVNQVYSPPKKRTLWEQLVSLIR